MDSPLRGGKARRGAPNAKLYILEIREHCAPLALFWPPLVPTPPGERVVADE